MEASDDVATVELPLKKDEEEFIDPPFQHEDTETYTLRLTYQQALRETRPDIDESTNLVIASMVVKKARYGVVYEEDVEEFITTINADIEAYYGGYPEERV